MVRQLDAVGADGPRYHGLHPHVQAHPAGHNEVGVQLGDCQSTQCVKAEEPPGPEEVSHSVQHVQSAFDHLWPCKEPQVLGDVALGQVLGGVCGLTATATTTAAPSASPVLQSDIQDLFRTGAAQVVGAGLSAGASARGGRDAIGLLLTA